MRLASFICFIRSDIAVNLRFETNFRSRTLGTANDSTSFSLHFLRTDTGINEADIVAEILLIACSVIPVGAKVFAGLQNDNIENVCLIYDVANTRTRV